MDAPRPNRTARVLALVAAIALAGLGTGSAGASGHGARPLTPADQQRLASFDATRVAAVAEAEAGGDAADVKELRQILAGEPQPILGVDIRGSYRCRTIKLGGPLPLTIYGWFACRIDEDDQGYRIVKTTGSQRFSGHFIDDSRTRLIYFGAGHYADEKPKAYPSGPDSDQVGYLLKVGPGRYRLELPLPRYESKFDIIELVKR